IYKNDRFTLFHLLTATDQANRQQPNLYDDPYYRIDLGLTANPGRFFFCCMKLAVCRKFHARWLLKNN
ncbi:MAG: hypothetical protein U5R30_04750, partial [Deltaproteobacteria bacterium]|nr:hypothetical protein [Deltaproteobacteria bacterium]